MANRGVFPAVDVLQSTSRLMIQLVGPDHLDASRKAVSTLADYQQAEDLIRIGAYQTGSDPAVDRARVFVPQFEQFTSQPIEDGSDYDTSLKELIRLVKQRKGRRS